MTSHQAQGTDGQTRAEDDSRGRIDEERLRIARELGDVVAHIIAVINVQAGVAGYVMADRPEAAAEALQTIKRARKDGLREMQVVLRVLRQVGEADSSYPAPGLTQLDALIARTCRAGLATTVTVTGAPRPLPAETDLAAYRIIEESLTNAIPYASSATATVRLTYKKAALRIEIADAGSGSRGLIGLREWAASCWW
ncbi:MAG: sensor histidine kinase [Streptosporangiaceae bacterium]